MLLMGKMAKQGLETRKESYDLLVAKVKSGVSLTPTELSSMARLEAEFADSGMDSPDGFASVKEVADYTGYSTRTVHAAVQSGELKRLSDNSFDFIDVSEWMDKKGRKLMPPRSGKEGDELACGYDPRNEEARYRFFRAEREEILVKKLRGELLPRDEVERQNVRRVHEFKTSLLLLSRRIDYRIAAACGMEIADVKEIIDMEGLSLLKTLSRKVTIHVD